MNIYVKTLTGRKINFTITEGMTFGNLQDEISEKEGIERNQIRMIYAGNMVTLSEKIMESKIKSGDIIHMVLSLRGG